MKNKAVRVTGIILFVFIVAAGVLFMCFKSELKAYILSKQYKSASEIETKIYDSEKKQEEIIKEYTPVEIHPLSEDDEKALASGEITVEEAVGKIISGSAKKPEQTQSEGDNVKENADSEKEKTERKTAEYIAKIYALKGKYSALISAADEEMAVEFYKLPKNQQTTSNKYKIAAKKSKEILNLQKKCDGEVNQILNGLQKLLNDSGQPTDIVEQIKKAYAEEKELTKAYYINKHTD